ncbi:hypothetical protein CTM58_04260 [Prevotella intermedia]|uniref:Uncharacterized protein n=1 Tax=Prevotella intermedia TaxID=28131 RepID=A0A2M8TTV8_PREIN|nr:hypothetical protein CTM58_04260 [Prevotella intermedia]
MRKGERCVNIFHNNIFRVTVLLSTLCKTYCFAFQKRRFCTVKAAVLHRKTYAFAMSKRSYHFLTELSLQSQSETSRKFFCIMGEAQVYSQGFLVSQKKTISVC